MAQRCKYCGKYEVVEYPSVFGITTKKCTYCGKNQDKMKGRKGQSLYPDTY